MLNCNKTKTNTEFAEENPSLTILIMGRVGERAAFPAALR
jgi:hypothetical protein